MTIHTHLAATAASIHAAPLADLMARRAALMPLWLLPEADMSDAEADQLGDAQTALEDEILARPCANLDDLVAKFALWADLVADPACILDEHNELFAGLRRDVMAMIGARQ